MHNPVRTASGESRGFTLIELMVALVLFALGTLALAALIPTGAGVVTGAGQNTRASELCALKMEQLLDTPYSDSLLIAGTHQDPDNPYPGSYHVSWVVEDNQPYTDCKRITVYARWPNAGSARNARLIAVSPESSWD
jgi:prepilin-type N-terminal cleavage/methylation domain-containing protein